MVITPDIDDLEYIVRRGIKYWNVVNKGSLTTILCQHHLHIHKNASGKHMSGGIVFVGYQPLDILKQILNVSPAARS